MAIPYSAAQWNPDDSRQAHGCNTDRNVDLFTCVNPIMEARFAENMDLVVEDQRAELYYKNHVWNSFLWL